MEGQGQIEEDKHTYFRIGKKSEEEMMAFNLQSPCHTQGKKRKFYLLLLGDVSARIGKDHTIHECSLKARRIAMMSFF